MMEPCLPLTSSVHKQKAWPNLLGWAQSAPHLWNPSSTPKQPSLPHPQLCFALDIFEFSVQFPQQPQDHRQSSSLFGQPYPPIFPVMAAITKPLIPHCKTHHVPNITLPLPCISLSWKSCCSSSQAHDQPCYFTQNLTLPKTNLSLPQLTLLLAFEPRLSKLKQQKTHSPCLAKKTC